MAYAVVGTSRQLAVGPVAVTSLLISTSMRDIVPCANSESRGVLLCTCLHTHKQKNTYQPACSFSLERATSCAHASMSVTAAADTVTQPLHAGITNPNNPAPDQVECQDMYNRNVLQLAFLVAILYTAVGVLRLGW